MYLGNLSVMLFRHDASGVDKTLKAYLFNVDVKQCLTRVAATS